MSFSSTSSDISNCAPGKSVNKKLLKPQNFEKRGCPQISTNQIGAIAQADQNWDWN